MEKVYPINSVLRPTVQESLIKPLMDSSPAELTQLLLVHESKCKAVIYKYSQGSYLCSTTKSNLGFKSQESNKVVPTESASMNQTASLEDKSVAAVSTVASPPTVAMDCNGKKGKKKYSGVCGTQLQNLQQQSPQQLQQPHKQLQQQQRQYQSYEQIHPPQQQYQPQQLEQPHQQQKYHPEQQQHQLHQQKQQQKPQQQSKQPQQIHQQQQQSQEPQCQQRLQQTQELHIQEASYKLQQYERRLKSKQSQHYQSKETRSNQKIQEVQRKQRIYQMAMKVLEQQNRLKQQQQQQNIYRQQQQNISEQQKQHPMRCQQKQYQHQYSYGHQQQYQQDQEKRQYVPFKQQQQQRTEISIQSWTGSCAVEDDSSKEKYGNSRDMQTVANVKQRRQRKFKSTEPSSVLPEAYSRGNVTDAKYYWQRKSWDSELPLPLSETCSRSDKESPLLAVPSSSSHHSAMYVERTNNSELSNAAVSSNLRNEDSTETKPASVQLNRPVAPEVFKNFSKPPTKLHVSPDDSEFNKQYPYCILNSFHSKPRDMPERDNYPHLYTLLLKNKSQASKENVVDMLSTSTTTDLSGKKRKREN
ncbi:bromodomain-containing protein DDB_G0280777-like isoform X2 [Octopus bimaculoides]|nr:bromodomain-containing protein DDB_G0280777-like isoform X2 [Octopus bimaculoides]